MVYDSVFPYPFFSSDGASVATLELLCTSSTVCGSLSGILASLRTKYTHPHLQWITGAGPLSLARHDISTKNGDPEFFQRDLKMFFILVQILCKVEDKILWGVFILPQSRFFICKLCLSCSLALKRCAVIYCAGPLGGLMERRVGGRVTRGGDRDDNTGQKDGARERQRPACLFRRVARRKQE